ncbi:MAG: C4-dicarboxylate ABC transporter permease [Candidatus Rokuibacteriota bacterium]|nr:MAG: C4-dicarboxylate ABC transporter permease [Candidatus Rokubacteria bacterium]
METTSKFRRLSGAARGIERALLVALTLISATWATQVHHRLPWAFFNEQFLGVFLGLALASVFVAVKARGREAGDRVPTYDWALSALGLVVGGYVAVMYPTIAYRLGELTPDRVLLGSSAVLLVLEAARRLAGGTLAWVALACILYAKFAWLFPSLLYAKGSSWSRIVSYLYLDTNGVFGVPLQVAASVLVAFIFFGHALYAVRGDRFLMEIALVLMGRYRGGAAKVSVVSSALFGTVSGSAVANVAVNGAFSIPLMKQTGYAPHMAAAIEAVASTGGQIMPPVMGAAAFLIAEFLNISYGQVALAAAIPACLYYLALFTQVDLEAARTGMAGLPPERIPKLRAMMRHGWVFLVPLAVLVYTLMIANWEAGPAGMAAVVVTFGVGLLQREHRPSLARVVASVEETGRTLLDIVAITALAGLVIGTLNLSGFIFKISLLLVTISGGHALLLLIVTALGCLFLGLPLPTTVVYITLAVLIAPALVQVGIHPLAAHLFLFYFGMISLITPPDCLPTYTAAAMARADFWKTGWTGMRLAIAAYVVPFVFAFHPALILVGTWTDIVTTVITSALGTVLIGVGCAGYLFRPLGWVRRAWAIAAGLLLFMPAVPGVAEYVFDAAGLLLAGALVGWERSARAGAVSTSLPASPA